MPNPLHPSHFYTWVTVKMTLGIAGLVGETAAAMVSNETDVLLAFQTSSM